MTEGIFSQEFWFGATSNDKKTGVKVKDYLTDTSRVKLDDIRKKTVNHIMAPEKKLEVLDEKTELLKELGLERQIKIKKITSLGFPVIRKFEKYFCSEGYRINTIGSISGEIPISLLKKMKEVVELDIFDKIYIAEEDNHLDESDFKILVGKKSVEKYCELYFYIMSSGTLSIFKSRSSSSHMHY